LLSSWWHFLSPPDLTAGAKRRITKIVPHKMTNTKIRRGAICHFLIFAVWYCKSRPSGRRPD
jgi:hypothetical protein